MRDPEANERLTAVTAVALLVLLGVEGVTIVFLRPLLPVHMFVGVLLIPPVALKLASVGWRFARYYRGDPAFRSAGPPRLPMRALAPVLVATTVTVLSTGVALLLLGRGHAGFVLGLHKASFVVWLAVASVHVLAYVWRLPRLVLRERRVAVYGVVVASVLVGLALALETMPFEERWLG
jgi:hypothetical protein